MNPQVKIIIHLQLWEISGKFIWINYLTRDHASIWSNFIEVLQWPLLLFSLSAPNAQSMLHYEPGIAMQDYKCDIHAHSLLHFHGHLILDRIQIFDKLSNRSKELIWMRFPCCHYHWWCWAKWWDQSVYWRRFTHDVRAKFSNDTDKVICPLAKWSRFILGRLL